MQVLLNQDFNQKHNRVSMKPLHFNCLLRLSKSQLHENGFKDMVIEMIYGQLLEYLATQSHKISFPELSLICTVQVRVLSNNLVSVDLDTIKALFVITVHIMSPSPLSYMQIFHFSLF